MTPYTFTFPTPAPKLSLNDRDHWAVKAATTKAWRTAAFVACRNAGLRDLPPCLVRVTFTVRNNRRADPSNLLPTVKACVDGMVDAGAWTDDNSEWVSILEPKRLVDRAAGPTPPVLIECWPMDLTTEAA